MVNLVQVNYQELSVSFTEDAWFNATTVAERFGKRPNDWLNQKETKEYIAALAELLKCDPKSLLKTKRGGVTRGTTITSQDGNGPGTWMHPKLGVPFARWLDVSFGVWCDDQIYQILTGKHPHYDWKKLRHEAASSFKVMNAVLQMQRQMQDKPVAQHHFSNEARLINWALAGEFKGLDRDNLSTGELDLLAKLEERNTVLLGLGIEYGLRKIALDRFATDWRSIHTPALEAV